MVTDSRKNANKKWDRENSRKVTFQFYKDKDKEILEKVDQCSNKTNYVRELIKKDIKHNNS